MNALKNIDLVDAFVSTVDTFVLSQPVDTVFGLPVLDLDEYAVYFDGEFIGAVRLEPGEDEVEKARELLRDSILEGWITI